MGSGDGELECYAIIGIWPCVSESPCVLEGRMMSQRKMKATWSHRKMGERERKVCFFECKSVT